MAKKKVSVSSEDLQSLVAAAAAALAAKKASEETSKVGNLKKSLEDSGLNKLNLTGGGLLTPFTSGLKAAIKEQDRLAKTANVSKAPALPKAAILPKAPIAPKVPAVAKAPAVPKLSAVPKVPAVPKVAVPKVPQAANNGLGETSQHLEALGKALDKISLKIGQALLPAFDSIVTALIPLATSFGQFVADNPALVQALAVGAVAFTVITAAAIGLATVIGVLTSPIGLIAAAIAVAAVIIMLAWKPLTGFFNWAMRLITVAVIATADAFKALPAAIAAVWGKVTATWDRAISEAGKFLGELKTRFVSGWNELKNTLTSWSPLDDLKKLWDEAKAYVLGIGSSISDGFRQSWNSLKEMFNWSPMDALRALGTGVTTVLGDLGSQLGELAAPFGNFMRTLFDGDPLEALRTRLGAIPEFFSSLLEKLKPLIQPIKDLISSVVDGVSGFFGGGDKPVVKPALAGVGSAQDSALLSGGLARNSNLLIQQTAANNRTQLEGGLTVSFTNAPAGLRVDQPQTNQPGLSLTPRVGYRSLSFGGAYGEQLA
ncbi:hypothetical protein [Pseudomonas gingeri]|uniref:hypothetical protein n=1 Tax=Pseudomonas gingeri TaxID=117681 RepID=UPI00210DC185|nr:hypothetical protein [Pseudomonas gingeri]